MKLTHLVSGTIEALADITLRANIIVLVHISGSGHVGTSSIDFFDGSDRRVERVILESEGSVNEKTTVFN
jgi:hypothetical protein